MNTNTLMAEWQEQDAILLAFPHQNSDWKNYWTDIIPCYINIINTIAQYQTVIVLCDDASTVSNYFDTNIQKNCIFVQLKYNDTWARDFGVLSIVNDDKIILNNFIFNAWGNKFDATLDNQINKKLYDNNIFIDSIEFNNIDFILEGGAVESNGKGTILTTAKCVFNQNRNPTLTQEEIIHALKKYLSANKILVLYHGDILGDDTDAHIDTLARYCNENTIAYVQTDDTTDAHYLELLLMEKELLQIANEKQYNLVPLPVPSPIYAPDDNRRLPATYANFLILNDIVLMPTYNVTEDDLAITQLQKAFSNKKVIGIDASALILQHGSLHCITMQLPKNSINKNNIGKIIII
ncbi:MAG: agmatine deiminase family protein [Chitinophagales bacterium]|nr:agmatine deiminase family protein [Chitinophagales bacterium]